MADNGPEQDPHFIAAARTAHTFHMDPALMLMSSAAVRDLEYTNFEELFALRVAAHNVIAADQNAAIAAAEAKQAAMSKQGSHR